ncbi:MAG TPA: ABC transporter permease, partial [Alphaproteobacteria bacterium]|nr:ABC transporter permease [Alphaproteobacteria bacterium]
MFFSALSLAWREIRHNPMRSGLTTLGIIIGVAAVIILVTLGNGASASITNQIKGLGTNLLVLFPGAQQRPGPPMPSTPFKMEDVEAIERGIRGIAAVSAITQRNMSVVYENRNHITQVQGSDNAFFKTRNFNVETGRDFTPAEERSGLAVCVIGKTVRDELFGSQTPLGATIRIDKVACKVIGLLESKGGSSFGGDQDDLVVAPIRMVQRRITGNRDVSMIYVSTAEGENTDHVRDNITRLIRDRRGIREGQDDDFVVRDLKEVTNVIGNVIGLLTTFLTMIAAVSLVVGGIGIMNIMLVSVTERTREIGIRLAIGALERDVLVQFLIEAVALSLLG